MDQVSISLHREARVKRMIGILRVLIAAAIATAVYFLVAGMVAGGVALLGMMGVAWVVSEKSSCARPVREPFAALRGECKVGPGDQEMRGGGIRSEYSPHSLNCDMWSAAPRFPEGMACSSANLSCAVDGAFVPPL
ncbi:MULTISPECIES: hypothetical protein [unclassified Streptomyces]|uniref:hypothetical protein n=1 Tax=unclassified Streptomyces TaxID=2593676 RepID=UPI0028C4F634|nr:MULTISPECIES: hypothetical protein [unclassified Streptomyces]WNO71300.1 hypothetical protein RPQ07_06540 [Streptomyces sp. AM8-1-1]